MSRTWMGLDVGTSSIKAVLFDETGQVVADAKAVTPWTSTAQGTEMDSAELGRTAVDVIDRAVRALAEPSAPAGIGITSMGETGVLVDEEDRPVGPAIAWHDTRDHAEVAALDAAFGAAHFAAVTGKPLRAQFSLTKFAWQAEHTPQVIAAARRRFNVAEWVAFLLTGQAVSDLSLAGRTGWFDPLAAQWSPELLAWSGATAALLPPLTRPGDPVGTADLGLAHVDGAVVTTAGHDHQAAMLGAGLSEPGDELDSLGTAEAIVRLIPGTLDRPVMRELARAAVTTDIGVQPGTLCLLGGTLGGKELQEFVTDHGVDRRALPRLDDVTLGVAEPRDDAERELSRQWRAAVDRATAQAADLHDQITAAVGPHRRLMVAGGWRHSRTVLDSKRRAFGDVELSTVLEAGARGAALLAARAAGHPGDLRRPTAGSGRRRTEGDSGA